MKNVIWIALAALWSFSTGLNASAEKQEHGQEHGQEEHAEEKPAEDHGHEEHARDKYEHEQGNNTGEEGHDDHEEGGHGAGGANLGKGKAVEAFDEKNAKLQLSQKAIDRLKLKSEPIDLVGGGLLVPRESVVSTEGKPYVFLAFDKRWYQRVSVTIGKRRAGKIPIHQGLKPGSRIVIEGASFLRIAELDLLAGEAVGHGH